MPDTYGWMDCGDLACDAGPVSGKHVGTARLRGGLSGARVSSWRNPSERAVEARLSRVAAGMSAEDDPRPPSSLPLVGRPGHRDWEPPDEDGGGRQCVGRWSWRARFGAWSTGAGWRSTAGTAGYADRLFAAGSGLTPTTAAAFCKVSPRSRPGAWAGRSWSDRRGGLSQMAAYGGTGCYDVGHLHLWHRAASGGVAV